MYMKEGIFKINKLKKVIQKLDIKSNESKYW